MATHGVIETHILPPTSKEDADLAFAKSLGVDPATAVIEDLPVEVVKTTNDPSIPPVYRPVRASQEQPLGKITTSEGEELKGEDAVTVQRLLTEHNRRRLHSKKIVNADDENLQPCQYFTNRVGKFPYTVDSADIDNELATKGMTLLDNVCGRLPYTRDKEFRNGIFINPLTFDDAALIREASLSKSGSALYAALDRTVNVPYRRLTIADHHHVMYYHLLKSYPPQRLDMSWRSRLYGVKTESKVHRYYITEKVLKVTREQWVEYYKKGFTLPRVYDQENLDGMTDVKDGFYIETAQYLDPFNPALAPFIKKAAAEGSVNPRLDGRIALLKSKPASFKDEIDKFVEAVGDYGFEEHTFLSADVSNLTLGEAIDYLYVTEDDDPDGALDREYDRLLDLLEERVKDRITVDTSEDERLRIYAEARNSSFVPVEERVPLNRNQWQYFPFL